MPEIDASTARVGCDVRRAASTRSGTSWTRRATRSSLPRTASSGPGRGAARSRDRRGRPSGPSRSGSRSGCRRSSCARRCCGAAGATWRSTPSSGSRGTAPASGPCGRRAWRARRGDRGGEPARAAAAGRRGQREFDLAFVDGDHRFEGVFLDLYFMTRLVKPGGLVVVDDMWMPSVRTAVAYVEKNLGLDPRAGRAPGRLPLAAPPTEPRRAERHRATWRCCDCRASARRCAGTSSCRRTDGPNRPSGRPSSISGAGDR